MRSMDLALPNEIDAGTVLLPGKDCARATMGAFDLALYDDLAAVEADWRSFQQYADCTAFQTFRWQSAWQRHIGARNGAVPCVVVVRDLAGAIACILPLATRPAGFARELVWLGSELCDYNAPLLAPGFSARVDHAAFNSLWRAALTLLQAQPHTRFDMIRLDKMPESIRGQANPMLALSTSLHPSGCYATALAPAWEAFYAAKRSPGTRRRDRTKRNRLAAAGEIRLVTPDTPRDALAAFDVLIEQKSAFFARRGIPNLFARPGYIEFFREFAAGHSDDGLVHISTLNVGAQAVAANFGLTLGGRYYYVLSSYTDGELVRFGPGAAHLHELMRYAIDRQFTMFDFTVGDEKYKLDWCEGAMPLHDHMSVASFRGAAFAAPALAVKKLKRTIKQSPLLWASFSKARGLAAALAGSAAKVAPSADTSDSYPAEVGGEAT